MGEDQAARRRLLKDVYFEKQQGKKLLRKKLLPIHLQEKYQNSIPVEEVVPGLIQHLAISETHEEKLSSAPQGKLPRPSRWVIIDALDDTYKKALSLICKEIVISISEAGLGLGRSGTLVWLSVATSSVIFHFDVVKIGSSEVMKGGLGTVLQDSKVVKVVHDCRALEDLLHHQLNLNLINVFDTQIDDSLWLARPLAEYLQEHLAKEVMYLRELRLEQLDMMLVDLRQITEMYLGAMRDKDSLTVSQLEQQAVPVEVQRLGKQPSAKMIGSILPFIQHSRDTPLLRTRKK